ncbi:MAG: DUF126 domain-containing protein [Actinobacteria bacterium]|nr:MAG: DUF126 domain-containing protein [Actinomycetota bacterium]REK36421.1 MAG: DUF126 domain-containing protein [Actinomycetota bacterium]
MTRVLVEGFAEGPLLALDQALSFWGGVDAGTGRIIDRSHPAEGRSVAGVILSLPHGRGSSSAATVLAEMIRMGTGPIGLVLAEPDEIIVTGVFVANALYSTSVPVVVTSTPSPEIGRFQLDSAGCRRIDID